MVSRSASQSNGRPVWTSMNSISSSSWSATYGEASSHSSPAQVARVGLVAPQERDRDLEDRHLLAEEPVGDLVPLLAGAAAGVSVDEQVRRRQAAGQRLLVRRRRRRRCPCLLGAALGQHGAAEMRARVGAQLTDVAVLLGGQLRRALEVHRGQPWPKRLAVAPLDARRPGRTGSAPSRCTRRPAARARAR